MVRILTFIPKAIVNAVRGTTSGTFWLVAWRLFLIIVGTFLIVYIAVSTSSFLALTILGFIITAAIGMILRKSLVDIWNFDFWRLKL